MSTSRFSNGNEQADSLVSAANLLIVSILKLNRVVVPALLRWQRASRKNWILRSSQDVADDMRKHPGRRSLCVSGCCLFTYDRVASNVELHPTLETESVLEDNGSPTAENRNENGAEVELERAEQGLISSDKPWPKKGSGANSLFGESIMLSDERNFRLLVLQEERHRELTVVPWVYRSVLLTTFSLVSLIVYCTIIIAVVVSLRDMSPRRTIVFIFSLIATAVVSDADMLLSALRSKPLRVASIDDNPDSSQEVANNTSSDGNGVAFHNGAGENSQPTGKTETQFPTTPKFRQATLQKVCTH